jgi:hypothetical protein
MTASRAVANNEQRTAQRSSWAAALQSYPAPHRSARPYGRIERSGQCFSERGDVRGDRPLAVTSSVT